MDFIEKIKRIFCSVMGMISVALLAFVAILCNMFTVIQNVNHTINEKIFIASHAIIAIVLLHLKYWIIMENPRSWGQDSSLWIIAICVVIFLCVALIDSEWIYMEHLLTTVASILLLTVLGLLVLCKPRKTEEMVRVPEQPIILPINEVASCSQPSMPITCESSESMRMRM